MKETPNFQSAQPVDLPPGTTLYRVIDDDSDPAGCYWTNSLPANEASWRSQCAVKPEWNSDGKVAVFTVPAGGAKVWMGPASKQGSYAGGGMQMYAPRGVLQPGAIYASPWAGRGGA